MGNRYNRAQRARYADLPYGKSQPTRRKFSANGLDGYVEKVDRTLVRALDQALMADFHEETRYGTHETVDKDGAPITVSTDPHAIEEYVTRFINTYGPL